ncbi:MAG: helical backbone metal receptor [Polyangiaceae bacterium]
MRPMEVVDDRGRKYKLPHPPRRIVSLVPSDTYTLSKLGGAGLLVGRTRYCVEPAEVARVEEVGGTKDPDVDRIIALAPDLVLMNKEENTERAVERLEEARIRAFVTFPRRLEDGIALVSRLARMLGDPTPETKAIVRDTYRAKQAIEARPADAPRLRVFVPIWMDPLMTVHADTYISAVLAALGADNVFADRRRAYPLAADLGEAAPTDSAKLEGRDTRYPRVTMAEVESRAPDVILLPSEPHAFSEADRAAFLSTNTPAAKSGRVHLVDGRDLMWPGLRSLDGLDRLRAILWPAANA